MRPSKHTGVFTALVARLMNVKFVQPLCLKEKSQLNNLHIHNYNQYGIFNSGKDWLNRLYSLFSLTYPTLPRIPFDCHHARHLTDHYLAKLNLYHNSAQFHHIAALHSSTWQWLHNDCSLHYFYTGFIINRTMLERVSEKRSSDAFAFRS